jgi:ABC-type polysaccharide/polyol phosphate transport system ATPase subunit
MQMARTSEGRTAISVDHNAQLPADSGADPIIVARGLSKVYLKQSLMFETPVPLVHRLLGRGEGLAGTFGGDPEFEDDDDLVGEEEEFTVESEEVAGGWALRDLTFSIARGRAVGVVGAPGSGKTTLLRILGGSIHPSAGRVEIHGRISPPAEFLSHFVTEELLPRQNLAVLAKALRMRRRSLTSQATDVFALAEPDPANPGAAKNTLALAAVLCSPHDVILVDEPLVGLSAAATDRVIAKLQSLVREGRTLLVASRDNDLVRLLCTEALLLRDGSLVQHGSVEDVVPAPPARRSVPQLSKAGPSRPTLHPGRPHATRGFNKRVAVVSTSAAPADPDSSRMLHIELRVEVAGRPVTATCAFGLSRADCTGLWVEQPEPADLEPDSIYVFGTTLSLGGLEPGAYNGRVELFVQFGTEESAIGRDDAFVVAVPEGARSSNPETAPDAVGSRYGVEWTAVPSRWSVRLEARA